MTPQKAFDKWLENPVEAPLPEEYAANGHLALAGVFKAGYNAAAKRIKELEEDVVYLNERLDRYD